MQILKYEIPLFTVILVLLGGGIFAYAAYSVLASTTGRITILDASHQATIAVTGTLIDFGNIYSNGTLSDLKPVTISAKNLLSDQEMNVTVSSSDIAPSLYIKMYDYDTEVEIKSFILTRSSNTKQIKLAVGCTEDSPITDPPDYDFDITFTGVVS